MNFEPNIIQANNSFENQKQQELFFTVKPLDTGLTDMLWELSLLYRVGRALSYTYVQSPLLCSRSNRLNSREKFTKKLLNIANTFIGIKNKSNKTVSFLGIDRHDLNIGDDNFMGYQVVDIPMSELFKDKNISDFHGLQNSIENFIKNVKPIHIKNDAIYSFRWTMDMFEFGYYRNLEQLLGDFDPDEAILKQLKLPEKYWQIRKNWPIHLPWNDTKIKILVHIRKGDRAVISINNKLIAVLGDKVKVFDSIESFNEWSEKIHVSSPEITHKTYEFLQQIFSKYGQENFSVIVISDGYQMTFEGIKKGISRGEISLNSDEIKKINLIKKNEEFNIFKSYSNIYPIIGESETNLFKSIHAIGSADIVIRASKELGGFANTLQRFLKKPEHSPIMIILEDKDNKLIDKIEEKIKSSAST